MPQEGAGGGDAARRSRRRSGPTGARRGVYQRANVARHLARGELRERRRHRRLSAGTAAAVPRGRRRRRRRRRRRVVVVRELVVALGRERRARAGLGLGLGGRGRGRGRARRLGGPSRPGTMRPSPKSATHTEPSSRTSTFSGLRSRCTTPRACTNASARGARKEEGEGGRRKRAASVPPVREGRGDARTSARPSSCAARAATRAAAVESPGRAAAAAASAPAAARGRPRWPRAPRRVGARRPSAPPRGGAGAAAAAAAPRRRAPAGRALADAAACATGARARARRAERAGGVRERGAEGCVSLERCAWGGGGGASALAARARCSAGVYLEVEVDDAALAHVGAREDRADRAEEHDARARREPTQQQDLRGSKGARERGREKKGRRRALSCFLPLTPLTLPKRARVGREERGQTGSTFHVASHLAQRAPQRHPVLGRSRSTSFTRSGPSPASTSRRRAAPAVASRRRARWRRGQARAGERALGTPVRALAEDREQLELARALDARAAAGAAPRRRRRPRPVLRGVGAAAAASAAARSSASESASAAWGSPAGRGGGSAARAQGTTRSRRSTGTARTRRSRRPGWPPLIYGQTRKESGP